MNIAIIGLKSSIRKERLYNPLRQNYGHVQALKELLQSFGEITYIPIISFSTRADLKLEPMKSEVIYSTQLNRTIKKYQSYELSKDKAEEIFNYLTASKLLVTIKGCGSYPKCRFMLKN